MWRFALFPAQKVQSESRGHRQQAKNGESPQQPVAELVAALVVHRVQHPQEIEDAPLVIAVLLHRSQFSRDIDGRITGAGERYGVGRQRLFAVLVVAIGCGQQFHLRHSRLSVEAAARHPQGLSLGQRRTQRPGAGNRPTAPVWTCPRFLHG